MASRHVCRKRSLTTRTTARTLCNFRCPPVTSQHTWCRERSLPASRTARTQGTHRCLWEASHRQQGTRTRTRHRFTTRSCIHWAWRHCLAHQGRLRAPAGRLCMWRSIERLASCVEGGPSARESAFRKCRRRRVGPHRQAAGATKKMRKCSNAQVHPRRRLGTGFGDVPRDDNSVGLIMVAREPLARRTHDSAMRAPTWVPSSVSCALAPTDSTTHTPRDYNQST